MIFELPNCYPSNGGRPTAQAVYDLLRGAILNGELASGCRLPPTRLSSERFGLSRSTMVAIYERLAAEELVESRRGSGTYVSYRPEVPQPVRGSLSRITPPSWLANSIVRRSAPRQDAILGSHSNDVIELRPGFVDSHLFPFATFRRSMAKALRYMERAPRIQELEGRSQGDPRLRNAIADHTALMRTISCGPGDVMITSGAQQTFELLAAVLVVRGTTVVAMEEPRHAPLAEAFEGAGAAVRLVPVDRDGMVVDLVPADANIICVSPSSQRPLGVAMSVDRRRQLHELSNTQNCLIIEDDDGGELRTDGNPLPALYGRDPDRIFYVGSFSTSMLPSFRLGYLIAPVWALEPLASAKCHTEWQSSSVMQSAAACFLTDGYLSAHISKMRSVYAERKKTLSDAIDARFGDFLRPLPSGYGLHLAAIGNPAINWKSVAERARKERIHVQSLLNHDGLVQQSGLAFGVGIEPPERLRTAIDRLATLL